MTLGPLAIGGIAALAVGVAILLWFAFGGANVERKRTMANLKRQLDKPKAKAVMPDRKNVSDLDEIIRRQSPPVLTKMITRLWSGAGRPEAWPVERILATQYLLLLVGAGLGFLSFTLNRSPMGMVLGVGVTLLGFFLPPLRLYSIGIERKEAIKRQLPDTLDQMSIAVNAGLGFDAAMVRVARNGRGELANELVRTLQDIQVGQTRRVAYEDLADRTGVETLHRFVRSIIQAEAYGIALSDVLQTQADELRAERRQYAERKAMEIPVKVVFPLILFIMPAMFIVVIGPGAISIIDAFSHMG
jgi:tight adherence protein C